MGFKSFGIIKSYIKQLTKNDIEIFANKNNITLNSNELDLIYYNIKNNYDEILTNPLKVLQSNKNKLSTNTYNKIYELYTIYYPKLNR